MAFQDTGYILIDPTISKKLWQHVNVKTDKLDNSCMHKYL